jgi:hypothetical protein
MLKKNYKIVVAFILAAVFVVSLAVSNQESTTMDEQAHIPSGYSYVKYNDMRLNPEHPPLLKDLAGIPLQFMNLQFPTDSKEWQSGINEQWVIGNRFIHSNNADAVTFWSRLPIILIALLLGLFIFIWTKEIAGISAGIFALLLYGADPNVLGHNHYVTTDIGIAAFIFISFYYFIRFLKKPSWKNVLLAGIFLGIVQLTKFSAVLLFPFFTIVAIIYVLSKRKPDSCSGTNLKFKLVNFGEYAGKYTIVIMVCFAAIWILYQYNTFSMPAEKVQEVAKIVFGDVGSGKIAKAVVIQMSTLPLLKGMSEYFLGVFMVFVRVTGGNTYYFLGKVTNHATQAYFPTVFLIKETLPMLMLIIFSMIYSLFQIAGTLRAAIRVNIKKGWEALVNYLRSGVAEYSMFGFILFYSYLSITGNLNIGFRHLFPVLPFAYVLVTKKIFDFFKTRDDQLTKKNTSLIVLILAIWIIIIPIIHFPSYISYFNELVGGPKNGYKYVTDSNTDWGQDLKRLRDFVEINKIDKIRVDYFGGSNPQYYLKDKLIPWHANLNPQPGWYAISAGFLQENLYKQKPPDEKDYRWTLNYQPLRIGDSIFVFHIP